MCFEASHYGSVGGVLGDRNHIPSIGAIPTDTDEQVLDYELVVRESSGPPPKESANGGQRRTGKPVESVIRP